MSFRRQFLFLRAYTIVSTLVLLVLATGAFRQAGAPQNLGEINVERINVLDANGTLRMVIANKDRMHPGVMDGKMIDRPRPVAGMIFFNDEGDEVGGLVFTGTDDGGRRANALLAFDQLKQDQTVGISYNEADGKRSAGLSVWDRSEQPLSDLIRALNAANALPPGPEREQAVQAARAAAPPRQTCSARRSPPRRTRRSASRPPATAYASRRSPSR